jgi:hypothetical protein
MPTPTAAPVWQAAPLWTLPPNAYENHTATYTPLKKALCGVVGLTLFLPRLLLLLVSLFSVYGIAKLTTIGWDCTAKERRCVNLGHRALIAIDSVMLPYTHGCYSRDSSVRPTTAEGGSARSSARDLGWG